MANLIKKASKYLTYMIRKHIMFPRDAAKAADLISSYPGAERVRVQKGATFGAGSVFGPSRRMDAEP